jgi:hypothetical protein
VPALLTLLYVRVSKSFRYFTYLWKSTEQEGLHLAKVEFVDQVLEHSF